MKLIMPYWLILMIPAAALMLRRGFSSKFLFILRVFVMILIIFALCRPALKSGAPGATVIAVCDLSDSMPESSEKSQIEAVNIIQSAMKKTIILELCLSGQKQRLKCLLP